VTFFDDNLLVARRVVIRALVFFVFSGLSFYLNATGFAGEITSGVSELLLFMRLRLLVEMPLKVIWLIL